MMSRIVFLRETYISTPISNNKGQVGDPYQMNDLLGGKNIMSRPKSRKERQWRARKNSNNPHGKVKSFEQLAEEAGKNDDK